MLESDCMSLPGHGQKGSRVKRPILGFLAAAIMSFGLLGLSPALAAPPTTPTGAVVTPFHHGDDHGHKYSHPHRQGGTRHHDHDWDDDDDHDGGGHHRRRCEGLIVICLV
jgi:hypothetical protein